MKMVIIAVVLTLALVPNVVHGRSGGAPDEACASVSPSLAGHVVGPQVTDSPFTLTISGSPSYYDPGCQYSLTFDRMMNDTFRGYLILARDMNNMNVGRFTAGANQRLACSDTRGITHTDGNVDKMYVELTWTAPPAGTGPIYFRYAGVVVQQMYWANQMGPMLNESNSTRCTSSSPSTLSAKFMTVAVLVAVLLAMMM